MALALHRRVWKVVVLTPADAWVPEEPEAVAAVAGQEALLVALLTAQAQEAAGVRAEQGWVEELPAPGRVSAR